MGEHVKEAAAPRRYRVTFLSVIGELLITIAVILGLFAVWQLYWTTYKVEGPRAQEGADFYSKHPSSRTLGERHTDDPPEFTLNPAIDELYGVIHVPSWNWMKIPLGEGTTGTIIDQGWAGHYRTPRSPDNLETSPSLRTVVPTVTPSVSSICSSKTTRSLLKRMTSTWSTPTSPTRLFPQAMKRISASSRRFPET